MTFGRFGGAKTLAPLFIFSVACARAGVPVLLVSPTSGGKSTVIFAVDKWLRKQGEPVDKISRLGLRGLKHLADWLNWNKTATLLNEDYSSIGSSEYMTEKLGHLIGSLTYSKIYVDYGLEIAISVTRLGFVSGVQPQWVKTMMTHPVFSTHLREKFLRYYCLPYTPTKDIVDTEAQKILSERLEAKPFNPDVRVPKEFRQALAFQVGQTRGRMFSDMIAVQLSALLPKWCLWRAMKFYAQRLKFEYDFVYRTLGKVGYKTETRWHEYLALYWALRSGAMTRQDYMMRFGVSSMRSVERVLKKALELRWVTSKWANEETAGTKLFMPSDEALRSLRWRA